MATAQLGTQTVATTTQAPRIASIDVFRGLTMLIMIFVNDLDAVKGLPWWTYHAPGSVNAMTYVDMVFPAFLFILGMAIPIAIEQRLRKITSQMQLWKHVVSRSFSLLVLGLILANASAGDPARIHMKPYVWAIVALFGAVLFWMVLSEGGRAQSSCQNSSRYGLDVDGCDVRDFPAHRERWRRCLDQNSISGDSRAACFRLFHHLHPLHAYSSMALGSLYLAHGAYRILLLLHCSLDRVSPSCRTLSLALR